MKVALLGFGTVGYGVYDILSKKDGFEIAYVLDLKKHDDISAKSVTDINEILNDSSVETVIELIGGLHPAYEFISAALESGKNVVTANKFVICEYYTELTALATKSGVALRYTAAVGGGIQWLVNLERMVKCDTVHSITGIINGTTNFILDKMHSAACDYNNALAEAQELGYAEADPTADTEGFDTLRKIVISASIANGASYSSDYADVLGISSVFSSDIKAAEDLGCVIRLLGSVVNSEKGTAVRVEPTFVSRDSMFAKVKQNLNYISVKSALAGVSGYFGPGAGRYPTAYTVVNDCIDIKNGVRHPYNTSCTEKKIDNGAVLQKYYIRTSLNDAWVVSVADSKLGDGVVTKEIPVITLHENIKRIKKSDPAAFAAAINLEV